MGRAKDQAGNIWETDADGNAIRLIQAGAMPLGAADPSIPARNQKIQNEAAASAYEPTIKGAEARIKEADAGVAATVANADAARAQAEAAKAQAELAKLKEEQGKVDPKSGAYAALQQQIDRVLSLYQQNLQGGLPNAVNDFIPDFLQPEIGAFDAAAQGLTNPFMAAFRIPGVGAQSDTELRQFLAANTPSAGDSDAVIEEKIRNIQTRLKAERPDASAALPQITGNQPDVGLSDGATRSQVDPVLKAIGQKVGMMLSRGDSDAAINKFIEDNGVAPGSTNIAGALQYRRSKKFQDWKRANPGKPYPLGAKFYTREIPVGAVRGAINDTAQSSLGTGIASAANAMSGGRLDNLVGAMGGDAEMARTGMELLRSQNPTSSLLGDLAGQAVVEYTVGRVPGLRALTSGKWGQRGLDAAYGAYAGSGENDADRLMGALYGAGGNTVGSGLGRRVQSGLGGAFRGVKNDNLRYLNDRGVPLTVGQIGRGTDSVFGQALGGVEERAVGLPGLDAVIGAARRRGDEGFNRAAFGEAYDTLNLPNPGTTGAPGVVDLRAARNGAYSFLDQMPMPVDAQLAGRNAMVRAMPKPEFGNVVNAAVDQMDRGVTDGIMPGRAWQDALRVVKQDRGSIAGKPGARQAVEAFDELGDNLMDFAVRKGPADTADNLARANRFNAQAETIAKALDNGPAQKADELFSAGRLDDAARLGTRGFGGRWAAMSGQRPFYDLASAGKAVMPNLTPDSGSIGRLAIIPAAGAALNAATGAFGSENELAGGLEGGADGLTKGAILAGVLSGLYSKSGQKIIQKSLLGPRSRSANLIGDYLKKNSKLGGQVGGALIRDLLIQPELPGY